MRFKKHLITFRPGVLLAACFGTGLIKPLLSDAAQSDSTVYAPDAQSGLANDWLRSQSSLFSAWDVGGQFRARYEHAEYLGTVDFSATGGHSSDNRMLLRTFVHVGYDPTSWLNFYAEGRDSRGFWDEPNPNPDLDTADLHQAFVQIGNPLIHLQLLILCMTIKYSIKNQAVNR